MKRLIFVLFLYSLAQINAFAEDRKIESSKSASEKEQKLTNIYTSKQFAERIKNYSPRSADITVPDFSFRMPDGWNVISTVIHDENRKKIGEFDPMQNMTGRKCFEVKESAQVLPSQRDHSPVHNKSTKSLSLNNRKVKLQTSVAHLDGVLPGNPEYWYIYHYCIMENHDRGTHD